MEGALRCLYICKSVVVDTCLVLHILKSGCRHTCLVLFIYKSVVVGSCPMVYIFKFVVVGMCPLLCSNNGEYVEVLSLYLYVCGCTVNTCPVQSVLRIRIRDPDWGLFDHWIRDPGSGIGLFRIPDPRSRIPDPGSQTHIFESLVTTFWVKSSIILWNLAQIFFLSSSKIK